MAEYYQKELNKVRKEVKKIEKAQKVKKQKAIRANIRECKLRKQAKKQ